MGNKIVIIGANHAGIAAANTILGRYPGNELTVIDRNTNISYLGCGTALWIGRQIKGTDGLFYTSKDELADKGANIMLEAAATGVDFDSKAVHARDKGGAEICVAYDKLIIATGSQPIEPKIPGAKLGNVHYVKLFQDGQKIDKELDDPAVKSVAIVGAGYIGVEIAEAVKRRGKRAILFESADTCLCAYYDPCFSSAMDKNLEENGVELRLGERIAEIEGKDGKACGVATDKGRYDVEMVILSIGFHPDSELGKERLRLSPNGAYAVDLCQRTSEPDVLAAGDCATVWSNAVEAPAYIALATNAVRGGILAGHNACGAAIESPGVQGSNGINIFGLKMLSTGLSLASALKAGFDAACVDYEDWQKPTFIAEGENAKVKLRIVYDKGSRRVLGAQMSSHYDVSMGIHMFSLAIAEKTSIDKIALLDIFFLPHFNQPYNYITMAALGAL
jgi:NADPH-dependent 2,4-dienoyl-CoA reductase/sulfur reductase-like enzyme